MLFKIERFLLLLILSDKYNPSTANDIGKNTQVSLTATLSSFLENLNFCTVQIFYERTHYTNGDLISRPIYTLTLLDLNLNFVIENLGEPQNRYVRANVTRKDRFEIIENFPFKENNFTRIFSNCHIALLHSLRGNPFHQMWGMAAFNEDPDFVVIHDSGYADRLNNFHFGNYLSFSSRLSLTSILLYSDTTSNQVSIVCHTCLPRHEVNDQNDKSIFHQKLYPLKKDSTLSQVQRQYNQLMKNMNHHAIKYYQTYRKFWEITCSLKHCGLNTPHTTCPLSEVLFRFNLSAATSFKNVVGSVAPNSFHGWEGLQMSIMLPGIIFRHTWIKHSVEYQTLEYTIYALPTELNANSLLMIFDILSVSLLTFFGGCSSLIIFNDRKFVFSPVMWTISMFLQQGTNIVIKAGEAITFSRLRVFMTYCIVVIWLFNSFFVGSMFGGEFFSLFSSNKVPQIPSNLKELTQAKDVPVISFSATFDVGADGNYTYCSTIKDTTIPQMTERVGYSPQFRKVLNDLKEKVDWVQLNLFDYADSYR
ncbi:hypothetical protein Fcan01_11725 [Folsomia candida]|uniref:Uncharacterized protein n=1 Tax=Folsomia candida TaxID=158441 RepID=A0A226EB75_FOLCA|nr:hypothetical protein Fcan01_11725 [Folsomia candida]